MTLTVFTDSIITSDQTPATGVAISYGANNVTVTINAPVLVQSLDSDAIIG